jgi:hypothetical protein
MDSGLSEKGSLRLSDLSSRQYVHFISLTLAAALLPSYIGQTPRENGLREGVSASTPSLGTLHGFS